MNIKWQPPNLYFTFRGGDFDFEWKTISQWFIRFHPVSWMCRLKDRDRVSERLKEAIDILVLNLMVYMYIHSLAFPGHSDMQIISPVIPLSPVTNPLKSPSSSSFPQLNKPHKYYCRRRRRRLIWTTWKTWTNKLTDLSVFKQCN